MSQSLDLKKQVLAKFNSHCCYCGTKLNTETVCIDHFIPLLKKADEFYWMLNKGPKGENTFENKVPACKSCTASKKDRTIDEWRRSIYDSVRKMRNVPNFNVLERFGVVKVIPDRIEFYFEKMEQKTLES